MTRSMRSRFMRRCRSRMNARGEAATTKFSSALDFLRTKGSSWQPTVSSDALPAFRLRMRLLAAPDPAFSTSTRAKPPPDLHRCRSVSGESCHNEPLDRRRSARSSMACGSQAMAVDLGLCGELPALGGKNSLQAIRNLESAKDVADMDL